MNGHRGIQERFLCTQCFEPPTSKPPTCRNITTSNAPLGQPKMKICGAAGAAGAFLCSSAAQQAPLEEKMTGMWRRRRKTPRSTWIFLVHPPPFPRGGQKKGSTSCCGGGLWETRAVRNKGCGKQGLWETRAVGNKCCGKQGLWGTRAVRNKGCKGGRARGSVQGRVAFCIFSTCGAILDVPSWFDTIPHFLVPSKATSTVAAVCRQG
eukprot:gene9625-biopygen7698